MHKSVLLNESIENLKLSDDSIIVDCTLGYAGHSSEILKRIPKGFLYAFDQDEMAIASSRERLQKIGSNFEIIKSNFVNLKDELNRREITKIDGILFDLGVSSPQLDEAERGFSFHQDAVLDMRMDKDRQISAKDIVNSYDYISLVRIFRDYGEEKYASSIAKGIIAAREEKEIVTTLELVDIIKNSVPIKYRRDHHPARKVFQAIRIEVNDELNVFTSALRQALDLIEVGGRICVITFHSLEDRICKNIFNEVSKLDKNLAKLPVVPLEYQPKYRVVGNISPSDSEILGNNRSRSARLRVIEKIR
ncbi:MAG: 16S rRNA (cytosine(1402)-N(4))-methyltransferase RsmH [Bacilli bacterium]